MNSVGKIASVKLLLSGFLVHSDDRRLVALHLLLQDLDGLLVELLALVQVLQALVTTITYILKDLSYLL